MPKFESETIETVGQYDKPIIVDTNDNTSSLTLYNWDSSEDMDISGAFGYRRVFWDTVIY